MGFLKWTETKGEDGKTHLQATIIPKLAKLDVVLADDDNDDDKD